MCEPFIQPDEEQLIAMLAAGDIAVIGGLAEQYRYFIIPAPTGNYGMSRHDAADVVQARFLELMEKMAEGQSFDVQSVWGWLAWMVRQKSHDLHRKATAWKRGGRVTVTSIDAGDGDVMDSMADKQATPSEALELKDEVRTALALLPHEQREVIRLRHWEKSLRFQLARYPTA